MLAIAEVPYCWAIRWRNRRYDRGAKQIHRVEVPVISVGNLTLGGTGKTPMVQWIVQQLLRQQINAGIVSRGYGRVAGTLRVASASVSKHATDSKVHPTGSNDEALELAWQLPGVPHVQNPDRLAAARRAIDEFGCEALVLDDAFQHRRIARDLDVVLLDALEPFGFGRVFPRGTLREPVEGLARADVIGLSRADLLTEKQRESLRDRAMKLAPTALWIETVHAPVELVTGGSSTAAGEPPVARQPLAELRGRPVLAFCGLGNPAGFRHTLATCGYEVREFHEFPDHHPYRRADLEFLAAAAQRLNVEAIVCTQKDLVKINRGRLGNRRLWAVRIGIEFLSGREELVQRLTLREEDTVGS